MSKQVHNYKLMEIIGTGEFGVVYKAIQIQTQQVYAVKQISLRIYNQTPKLRSFTQNEIFTLQKINNQHVVKFTELIQTNNNIYLIYEFCNGGTLENKITQQGKINEEESINYLKQILKGLEPVVKANIIHRDLKPQNILFHDGLIKIVDFGFCKPLKQHNMTKTMLGSPIYMAPEILNGQDYCAKADIWSLGVMTYEMLYGECPFDASDLTSLINILDTKQVVYDSKVNISTELKYIMHKMLQKDASKRISWEELFNFFLYNKQETIMTELNQKQTTPKNDHNKQKLFQSSQTLENQSSIRSIQKFESVQKSQKTSQLMSERKEGNPFIITEEQNQNEDQIMNEEWQKISVFQLQSLFQGFRAGLLLGLHILQEMLFQHSPLTKINFLFGLFKGVIEQNSQLLRNHILKSELNEEHQQIFVEKLEKEKISIDIIFENMGVKNTIDPIVCKAEIRSYVQSAVLTGRNKREFILLRCMIDMFVLNELFLNDSDVTPDDRLKAYLQNIEQERMEKIKEYISNKMKIWHHTLS